MTERFAQLQETLAALLEQKQYGQIREILEDLNPSDIAYGFEGL